MESNRLEQVLSDAVPDIQIIREILCEEEEQLKTLKNRGSIIVKKQRVALLRSALSPIRQLPAETLTEIFEAYLDMRLSENTIMDYCYAQVPLYHLPPVLFLSQVCSRWRRVTNMSPTLWKRLRLVLGRSGGLPPVEMVTAWLERSCSLPLEIEIVEDILSPNRAPIRDARFLDCLIPFCERWSHLKLRLDFSVLKSLLERDDLNLPNLEVLHVGAGCITEFRCIHAFRNASRLRQLWLSSWGRQPSPWHQDYVSSFAVSFNNITTLDVHMGKNGTGGSPYTYFHILSACTRLEKCSFGVDDFDDNPLSHFTDMDCITLSSLKDLGVTFRGTSGSPQILDAFAFPRLQKLGLTFEDYSRPFQDGMRVPALDILLRLRARSRFSLVTLEFLNMNDTIDTDGILEFFKAVPSLERVELMNCILDAHKISKALVVGTEPKTSLLPKLSYISIYTFSEQDSIIDNGPQHDDCIADMVESRLVALSAKIDSYSASSPLVFEVDFEIFHRYLRKDVLNRLRALEEWNTAKLRIITSAGDDN